MMANGQDRHEPVSPLVLAQRSAELRVMRLLADEHGCISSDPESLDEPAFWKQWDAFRDLMADLGHICQQAGQDLRHSPYWPLIECRVIWERAYEQDRPVKLDGLLNGDRLYHHLLKLNQVEWKGYHLRVANYVTGGRVHGLTGPSLKIEVKGPDGTVIEFPPLDRMRCNMLAHQLNTGAYQTPGKPKHHLTTVGRAA